MNNVVKSTSNYEMFDLYEMNREVNEKKDGFKNLVQSMGKYGWIDAYPMHCIKNGGKKLKIKGGHNRFRAAQILGIPVKYVVSDDNASIPELEKGGVGRWSTSAYFQSFVKQGIPDYLYIKNYIEMTGITLHNAASMFYGQTAGSGNYRKDGTFDNGSFEIRDYTHPAIVGDIVLFLKSISRKFVAESKFVQALSKIVKVKKFNPDRFKSKAETHTFLLTKQRNVEDYMAMIEEVYNYQSRKRLKVNIALLARQESEQRRVAGLSK